TKAVTVIAAPTKAAVVKGTCVMGERARLRNSRSLPPLNFSQFMFGSLTRHRIRFKSCFLTLFSGSVAVFSPQRFNAKRRFTAHAKNESILLLSIAPCWRAPTLLLAKYVPASVTNHAGSAEFGAVQRM